MTARPDGVLRRQGDGAELRFVRRLPQPPERVWRAVTDPAELAVWFPQTVTGRFEVGARLTFSSAEGPDFEGEVLAVDPPRLLSFTWGPDVLRLELRAVEGGTELTFTDRFAQWGKAARDGAGWHVCLDRLGRQLGDGGDAATWAGIHPGYVARFGPEAAAVGPLRTPDA